MNHKLIQILIELIDIGKIQISLEDVAVISYFTLLLFAS